MSIYRVTETIIELDEATGEWYYSSFAKAQEAILKCVAEGYTAEEMEQFKFEDDGYMYRTTDNKYVLACLYDIEEVELDMPIDG